MASEAQSKPNHPRPRRPPVAGVVVLLVVGIAVAMPFMMDSGCSPTRSAAAGNTEPMELWGRWLGMMLASADSGTARNLGIPAVVAGVVVAEVAREPTSRAAQVGLNTGDVIVKVDGSSTPNLAELYTLTTRLNTARPLPLEIMRQGQTMMIVLPPPMDAAALQQPMLAQPAAAPAMPQQVGAWNPAPPPAAPQPAAPQSMPQTVVQPGAPQTNVAIAPAAPAAIPPTNTIPGVMGR